MNLTILWSLKAIDMELSRKLLHELQLAYFDLLEIKLKIFEKTSGSLQPKLLQKMAYICKQGISTNEQILDTFDEKIKVNNRLGKSDDETRQILKAWFSKARFLNKFFAPNREEQMTYTREAITYYDKILCYCAQHPDAKRLIAEEYKMTVDVADLLKRQLKHQERENKCKE